jgi:hypothetical protein
MDLRVTEDLRRALLLTRLALSALATLSPQNRGERSKASSPLVLIPFHTNAR